MILSTIQSHNQDSHGSDSDDDDDDDSSNASIAETHAVVSALHACLAGNIPPDLQDVHNHDTYSAETNKSLADHLNGTDNDDALASQSEKPPVDKYLVVDGVKQLKSALIHSVLCSN